MFFRVIRSAITQSGNSISTLFNNGTGAFTAGPTLPSGGVGTSNIDAGFINGDTFIYIVVTNTSSDTIKVFFGQAGGTFGTSTILSVAAAGPTDIKVIDLNNDGFEDLAFIYVFTALVQTVYRGDSTLDPKHGELAYITATAVNNCFY